VISKGATVLVALLVGACAQVPTHKPELLGYYASWTGQPARGAERLSAISYAFLALGPDGSVGLADPRADAPLIAQLRGLKRGQPELSLFGSVGGWTGSGNFSNMAHDPASRARFIATSLDFLRREGFDGIDIDWEYPGAIGTGCASGVTCERTTDKEDFIRLAHEMRAAFDAAGSVDGHAYRITIAAGVDAKYASNEPGPWLGRLAGSLDWVNLMTYDYHGTWERTANYVAPLRRDPAAPTGESIDASVSLYLAEGIPARKLVLGVPFYGKGWTGCAPGPNGDGRYQACTDLARPDHEATFEFGYLEDQGFLGLRPTWNDAAAEASLFDPAAGTFVAYDDERSMREKARYAKERGLRGVMFWELAADRRGTLLRALADELGR
jgi:chitinase